jgi:CBS domain-containing protein
MSTVADLLILKGTDVVCVSADMTVLKCTQLMNEHRIGCVVVIDSQAKLIGVFSERDVLRRIVAVERTPHDTMVGEVMTTQPITCTPSTELDEIAQIMRDQRVRHVPVVDGLGHLRGMVSIGDLNALRVSEQDLQIQMLNDYVYGRA